MLLLLIISGLLSQSILSSALPQTDPSADFNPCNRTDGIIPCPYYGSCEFPPLSCPGTTSATAPGCPLATCRRNIVDWGNGVTSTGLTVYAATTQNGTKQFNPWECDKYPSMYGTTCHDGWACQRQWTRAPPICSPSYTGCDNGTACADGQQCVLDPRRLPDVWGKGFICVSNAVVCDGNGYAGDEGRAECGIGGKCVEGICVTMIDCSKTVYGCPGTGGFNYGDL